MSIEESFNFVFKCARKAGFDSFDSMVCQYYTSTFDKSSDLSIEQRESRNHRLPALLANLREHSTTWSTSEHDGYHDEILRSAEKLYLRERRSFEELSEPVSLAAAQSHVSRQILGRRGIANRLSNLASSFRIRGLSLVHYPAILHRSVLIVTSGQLLP